MLPDALLVKDRQYSLDMKRIWSDYGRLEELALLVREESSTGLKIRGSWRNFTTGNTWKVRTTAGWSDGRICRPNVYAGGGKYGKVGEKPETL